MTNIPKIPKPAMVMLFMRAAMRRDAFSESADPKRQPVAGI
jgi:hypothetical protein